MLNAVKHGDREVLEHLVATQTAEDAQRDLLVQQQQAYQDALEAQRRLLDDLEDVRVTYEQKVARRNDEIVELERQERIAARDEQQLAAALADTGPVSVPPSAAVGGWAWPARGPLTSGFGQRGAGCMPASTSVRRPVHPSTPPRAGL